MLGDLFRLDGKIIVITGAAGLLGRKHAEAIACYGGTPILLDLSQDAVDILLPEDWYTTINIYTAGKNCTKLIKI